MNRVPRHKAIVAAITGEKNAGFLTIAIGLAEIAMAAWIISGIKTRLNVIMQMIIVALMNTIEFFMAPDLLLFGKFNALFAALFILLIYVNEFILHKKTTA